MNKTLTYHWFPSFILIAVTLLLYMIWRANSPYPNTLNWDIWEHQTAINAIRAGTFNILPSALSDTFRFDGYTSLYHVFFAGVQTLLQIKNILGFWWIAEGIFFVLTSLATYMITYTLTRKRLPALAGGILSACFFESSMAYTTLFLTPQTVTALIWVIAIATANMQQSIKNRIQTSICFSLLMVLLHGIVGIYGSALLAIYIFGLSYKFSNRLIYVLGALAAAVAGYAIPAYLARHYALGSINSGEAQYFTQTIAQKLALFQLWYGWLPIPLVLLGLWHALTSRDTSKGLFVVLFGLSVGFLASPFPYVLKFIVIIRYIMIALISMGVALYVNQMKSRIGRCLLILVMTIAGALIFVTNTELWKKPVIFGNTASHVSQDEQNAASILKDRYGNKHAFLISDPATQYVLETLSGINSQGGAYMDIDSRKHIAKAFEANEKTEFVKEISDVQDRLTPATDRKILLVVGSRTIVWLAAPDEKRNSIAYNVWRPDALSLENELSIEAWKQRFGLNEVYRNASMVVFELPAL